MDETLGRGSPRLQRFELQVIDLCLMSRIRVSFTGMPNRNSPLTVDQQAQLPGILRQQPGDAGGGVRTSRSRRTEEGPRDPYRIRLSRPRCLPRLAAWAPKERRRSGGTRGVSGAEGKTGPGRRGGAGEGAPGQPTRGTPVGSVPPSRAITISGISAKARAG